MDKPAMAERTLDVGMRSQMRLAVRNHKPLGCQRLRYLRRLIFIGGLYWLSRTLTDGNPLVRQGGRDLRQRRQLIAMRRLWERRVNS